MSPTSEPGEGGLRLDHDPAGHLVTEYDPTGQTIRRRYVFGPGADEPVVWYEGAGLTDRRYLDGDERGSIVRISDGSGTAIATNSYDEYGIPGSGNGGRFGYTGQAWFPELGLYDYKNRLYSVTLGRFLQTDPIGYGDGTNWYDYVHGDPVNGSDPDGLLAAEIVVTAGGGGGGGGGAGLGLGLVPSLTVSTPALRDPAADDEITVKAGINCGVAANKSDLRCGGAQMPQIDQGSILEQRGRRDSVGKRGEAGKNPNPDKPKTPKPAYGKPGYVVDIDRNGQKGRPRPAREGEPGFGEGGSKLTAGNIVRGGAVVVFVGGAAVLLAPEVAAALAAAGVVSLLAN